MRMGGGAQQFGVDAERVPALLGILADVGLDLLGFHIFAGSQNPECRDPLRGAAEDRRPRPAAGGCSSERRSAT